MSKYPYRQNREELRELLQQYENLKAGKSSSFIDEDSFERIIDYYYEEKGKMETALEVAETGITQFPYSGSLLILKADILLGLRRYKEALTTLDRAELFDTSDSTLYILRTDAYLALDLHEKAAGVLKNAIQIFDGEEKTDLLFELADVYDDYEEFDKVFDCLKMILELEPNNDEALHKICFWTDYTGRNEEGIRLHQQIIEEYPFNELAWFNLAAAYQGLKLYEKSIDAYKYAIAIDEKFDYAYRNMGDAYLRLRKYKEAIEALEKVLELAKPEDVIYEAIGHCYDKLKNFAQARQYYRKASHIAAADSQLLYKIACTYISEQRWDSAIKNLEAALRIHPLQYEYNLAIGKCYWVCNKTDYAIDSFKNAITAKPKNPAAWTEVLTLLYAEGYYDEAFEYCGFALQHTGQKPIFIFYQSAILFAKGQTKEALVYLQKGMKENPKLIKKFIELNPSLLQHQQVVEIITAFKRKKSI